MIKEIWKDIPDYEGLYQVSNLGRIKRILFLNYNSRKRKEKILKKVIDKDGYYKVSLSKNNKVKNYFVHRLVAKAFILNPNNCPIINHKDENKKNNCVNNLEWCTIKYNTNYNGATFKRGLKKRKPILQIKNNIVIKKWDSATTASKELNISRSSICLCLIKRRHTAGGYNWKYDE